MQEWGMHHAKEAATPGVKPPQAEELARAEEKPDMEPAEATRFRRGVPRVVYMAQVRIGLAFASKDFLNCWRSRRRAMR